MTVKELIKMLKNLDPETKVVVASDEELNSIYKKFEVSVLTDFEDNDEDLNSGTSYIVIYPIGKGDY
jgi:predicted glycosyltransferase